jgi:hypothetical protein
MECLAIYPCATGDSHHSIMYLFKVATQPVSLIMPQVCEAHLNTDTSFQFVDLETRRKPFDHYRLVLGIRRVAENMNI